MLSTFAEDGYAPAIGGTAKTSEFADAIICEDGARLRRIIQLQLAGKSGRSARPAPFELESHRCWQGAAHLPHKCSGLEFGLAFRGFAASQLN